MKNHSARVYYAPIPDRAAGVDILPKERLKEIESVASSRVRREKYFVWKLLEYALKDAFNLEIANLQFTKKANGKWICPDVCFSLSHTDGALCVAVSHSSVGVDIEEVKSLREGLSEKILTDGESDVFRLLPECERGEQLLKLWCEKEAIFKSLDRDALMPKTIETKDYTTHTERVTLNGREYLIAVCAESVELVRTDLKLPISRRNYKLI